MPVPVADHETAERQTLDEIRGWHGGIADALIDFDDGGILDVLKQSNVMDNNIVGRYRECLRVRHRVGHGRYWAKPVEVDQIDPDGAYTRADAIIRAIPS
jgi:hypothetical protein